MSAKKAEAVLVVVIGGIIGVLYIAKIVLFSIINTIIFYKQPLIIIFSSCSVLFLIYRLFTFLYFKSKKFKKIKDDIFIHTKNCNELNHYIQELKNSYINISSYNYGESRMIDTSNYNFKRKEWNKSIKSNYLHQCSALVCKNASNQPIKYLCKYFGIEKNEKSLSKFERILNDFISVEQGKILLKRERKRILSNISKFVPLIIIFFDKKLLMNKLGFENVDFSDLHIPTFTFEYISPGGNSSSECNIVLNIRNLNNLINYLNDIIKWKKSIAGQRALMTSKLREKIKKKDNYTCRICKLSINDEPNLLLEIDHIIPLSKGGITTESNLQTLCWKCNRKKGAKIKTV